MRLFFKSFAYLLFVAVLSGSIFSLSWGANGFRISDIRIEGLQRISAGTVFASLPLNVGDVVDRARLQSATRSLFKSGYFDDIDLGRDGDVLVITVVERPAVASISIDGNKAIETDQLLGAMEGAGLSEGLIFRHAVLDGIAQEMERQYVSQGRYGASVEVDVENLPQNRVALSLHIKEGQPASIKHINIIGSEAFEKQDLLDLFELETTGFWSWMGSKDKYAKEKLEGDIERLKSWYLDRGYLRFKVDSAQVSLSPDKESIYIVINITEGAVYKVAKVDLAGELKAPEDQVRRLILLKPEAIFSQVLMTSSSERIKQRLGNSGYTFAEVQEITEINDEDHTVDVTFFVNSEERMYVRRINFRGNTKTADHVLRREMRQMEGALAATYKIEQSKVRLQRLGYFKNVELETVEVPGTGDQIDLEYSMEEQPSGSIGASIGFAQGSGLILGANIQQDNFLGSGKRVGFNVSTSSYSDEVSFNYMDPYYTPDGVSRGFRVFYTARDLDEVNISSYSVDTYGVEMTFGYPLSEIENIQFGLGYSYNDITVGVAPAQEIAGTPNVDDSVTNYVNNSDYSDCVLSDTNAANPDCVDSGAPRFDYDLANAGFLNGLPVAGDPIYDSSPEGFLDRHGTEFNSFTLTTSWRQSKLNRGRLATRGTSQSLSAELTVPGSDLTYWKLNYRGQYFKPLTRSLTLRLRTKLGYGDGYGDIDELPFYENFFAGGFGSVRGYKRNTVGPRSTPAEAYIPVYGQSVGGFGSNSVYVLCDNTNTGTPCQDATLNQLSTAIIDDPEGDPFGGNVLIEGTAEIIFPMPFIKDQRSLQPTVFLDAGNVFDTSCGSNQRNCFDIDLAELRYSVGLGLTWITGFGPLTFSVAKAIGDGEFDDTEFFQFSLGQTF